ncbi:hypothetical protein RCL1_000204 [Eukaryota sp. TZLM3-RCL]
MIFSSLCDIIQVDKGNRGIRRLFSNSQLDGATSAILPLLSKSSSTFIIISGFYIPAYQQAETDGPLGLYDLVRTLLSLNAKVIVVAPTSCTAVISAAISPIQSSMVEMKFVDESSDLIVDFDCLISIEAVGPSRDGNSYTMRGTNSSEFAAPLYMEKLFQVAKSKNVPSISIGDGGNELGSGVPSFLEIIARDVPKGELIACRVPSDVPIFCGVSNWGGCALSLCLAKSMISTVPNVYIANVADQTSTLARILEVGAVDGVKGCREMSVDGFPWEDHCEVTRSLRAAVGI